MLLCKFMYLHDIMYTCMLVLVSHSNLWPFINRDMSNFSLNHSEDHKLAGKKSRKSCAVSTYIYVPSSSV